MTGDDQLTQGYGEALENVIGEDLSLGKVAILLAITGNRATESRSKQFFNALGYHCVVTEVAGMGDELKKKIINATVGASLNLKIIEKIPREIHGLVHASLEACYGIKLDMPLNSSFYLKIAIVRKEGWIAVAIYGDSALHSLTNHSRIGLGLMHL